MKGIKASIKVSLEGPGRGGDLQQTLSLEGKIREQTVGMQVLFTGRKAVNDCEVTRKWWDHRPLLGSFLPESLLSSVIGPCPLSTSPKPLKRAGSNLRLRAELSALAHLLPHLLHLHSLGPSLSTMSETFGGNRSACLRRLWQRGKIMLIQDNWAECLLDHLLAGFDDHVSLVHECPFSLLW